MLANFRIGIILIAVMAFQGCKHSGGDRTIESWQHALMALEENLAMDREDSLSSGQPIPVAGPWYSTKPLDDVYVEEEWSSPEFNISNFIEGKSAIILYQDKPDITARDANGRAVWAEIPKFPDGEMHYWQDNYLHSIYLSRTITVPLASTATAAFRGSGYFVTPELQAWLNGTMVLDRSPVGDRYPYSEIDLNLKSGVNHLVVRAHNLYGFSFDFKHGPLTPGLLFLNQLSRQFPDSSARAEMLQEFADGIWNEPLGPVHSENIKTLAQRYARACQGKGYSVMLSELAGNASTDNDLDRIRQTYYQSLKAARYLKTIRDADFERILSISDQKEELQKQRDQYLALAAAGQENRLETGDLENLAAKLEALKWYSIRARIGAEELVFVERHRTRGYNWYGDLSFFMKAPSVKMYCEGGSRMCLLNLRTGRLRTFLEDQQGAFRDPYVHYDGKRILFSWRKGGTESYHLFEIKLDGTGLIQITDGPYDDTEGIYLPGGGIVFSSTRCNRWVACGTYRTSILYRCDEDGMNIRPLSSNIVSENAPWMLPDGRVMFMRWEYVDRNQMRYQHLWTINPDGTGVMVLFGNQFPNNVFIDAKPVPGSDKIVFVDIPFHGMEDRRGTLMLLDPRYGPDERAAAKPLDLGPVIGQPGQSMDPYPVANDLFLFVNGRSIFLADGRGHAESLYSLPEGSHPNLMIQEPRPVAPRQRENIIPARIDPGRSTGRLALLDVTFGRNMSGVGPGEIKKLLVLEQLPKPLNTSGGPEPTSMGGTFTLKRVLGTIPVESDGSAYMELPALRSLFFVALDENNLSVKRMQSFVTVQPGEFTSCSGCHEKRTDTPKRPLNGTPAALKRPASKIEALPGIPEVYDYPRDIQPILDRHCIACHDYKSAATGGPRSGGIILTGDHGPRFSHSYANLTLRKQISDGRNDSGNKPPRMIGTSASPLMAKIDGSHHNVILASHEQDLIRYWIEAGANYIGTYAALCDGFVKVEADSVIRENCGKCHSVLTDFRINPELIYNLSRPENSLALMAPLSKEQGGYGLCRVNGGKPVFRSWDDDGLQSLYSLILSASQKLERIKRFDMPGYRPIPFYFYLMKEYGLLPENIDPQKDTLDYYRMDEKYWRSFWYRPPVDKKGS